MSSKTSRISKSSEVIQRIFTKRQQDFIGTLEKVLQTVASDKIVRQMLSNKTSAQFITKRVEEIFYQIITSDREIFIDKLVEKIQTYENVYNDEYGEMVKILGNRILSISDAQNSSAVQRMRHIHTLIEEVKELQDEVATLRQQNAEKDGIIKSFRSTRKTNLFHDNITSEYMHIYAEVDITQLGEKVKEMSSDCISVKNSVFTLKGQLETIINEATKTTKLALAAMQRKNEQMEKRIKDEKAKSENLQKKFDEQVPQMQMELQSKQREIDSITTTSNQRNNEFRELKQKNQQALTLIEEMKKQYETLQLEYNELTEAHTSGTEQNEKLEKEITNLRKEVSKLTRAKAKLEDQIKEQKQETEEQKSANVEAGNVMKQLQAKSKALRKELEKQKLSNDGLAHDLEEKANEYAALEAKYSAIVAKSKELNSNNNKLSNDVSDMQDKIMELEEQLDTKKQENQQINTKLNQRINELEEEKNNTDNELLKTQENLKACQQKNAKMQKTNEEQEKTIKEQKEQIDAMQKQNDDLNRTLTQTKGDMKQSVSNLSYEKGKLFEEMETTKAMLQQKSQILDNLQKTLQDVQQQYNETKWHLDEANEEITEKNKKIEEAKTTIAGLLLNKEVDKDEATKLQGTVAKLTQQNSDLANEIRKMKKQSSKLTEQNDQLTQSLDNEHQDSIKLTKTIEEINDKLQKAAAMNQQYTKQIQALNSTNTDLNSILSSLNANNVGVALSLISDLKRSESLIKSISDLLEIRDKEELISAITELEHRSSILSQIEAQLKTENVQQAVYQLLQDMSTLGKMTGCKPNQTVIDSTQCLLDAYNGTKAFVVKLITTFSTQVSPQKIVFPIPQVKCDALIQTIRTLMEQSDNDKENINDLITKARSFGYSGSGCLEAAMFIAKQKEELEKKNSEVLRAQLEDVRSVLKAERDQGASDIDKRNKSISDLKKSLFTLSEKSANEKAALQKDISELEHRVETLNNELTTERTLRREIGRIGQGATADKRLLKSKLSENEYKFIEFIDEIMKKESKARAIHNDFKQARQALDI